MEQKPWRRAEPWAAHGRALVQWGSRCVCVCRTLSRAPPLVLPAVANSPAVSTGPPTDSSPAWVPTLLPLPALIIGQAPTLSALLLWVLCSQSPQQGREA